jgi:hypothetical protein
MAQCGMTLRMRGQSSTCMHQQPASLSVHRRTSLGVTAVAFDPAQYTLAHRQGGCGLHPRHCGLQHLASVVTVDLLGSAAGSVGGCTVGNLVPFFRWSPTALSLPPWRCKQAMVAGLHVPQMRRKLHSIENWSTSS